MTTTNTTNNPPDPTVRTRAAAALNHLSHGATSQSLFLPGENPIEFFALLESSFEHHQPTQPQDSGLVADTVLARWFLLRRQRVYVESEGSLHRQKPLPEDWDSADLDKLNLFDRYKTQSERALTRALNNVRHIRKDAQSELRWQAQYELQKMRFALQCDRFELAQQKEARRAAKAAEKTAPAPAPPTPDPPASASVNDIPFEDLARHASIPEHHQTLFIGLEDERTIIYNVEPTNNQLRKVLQESDSVTRTYNFVGGVPEAYKHLVTEDSVTWGMSTSVIHTHSYSEWRTLADRE